MAGRDSLPAIADCHSRIFASGRAMATGQDFPMTILVTGAGGFVGRELVSRLVGGGADRIIALDSHMASLGDYPAVQKVEADLSDHAAMAAIFDGSVDAVIHLAALPGGAAEADPALSRRVNLDATLDLIDLAAGQGNCPRFVFASTIAVFGDPLPAAGVDDATPLKPRMIYGMHKAMIETAIATMTRRGAIDGISLRLPGIIARPQGAAGLKSAFMSDIFHALLRGDAYTLPVSPDAQLWLMSVGQCTRNLAHALQLDTAMLPEHRALTLPALRVSMATLAEAVAQAVGVSPAGIGYAPDAGLEAAFGAHPLLSAAAAERVGLAHDGSVEQLVEKALATIGR
jgi:nucleoside-diphosphate-sugar epimerase